MLTKAELELIAELLDMAAEDFSNHGCNDFWVVNFPPKRKIIEAAQTFVYRESPNAVFTENAAKVVANDSVLMTYLAERARQEARAKGESFYHEEKA